VKPVHFPEANRLLGPPLGVSRDECGDLHTFNANGVSVSCWAMTWRDRLRALVTGRVWLHVWSGPTQPPVAVSTETPFVRRDPARQALELLRPTTGRPS